MSYQFEILVGGYPTMVNVQLLDRGNYEVWHGQDKLGVIYPDPESSFYEWKTRDVIAMDVLQQIGKKIESLDKVTKH